MSNYYGTGRTNTFKVKDVDALKTVLEKTDFTVLERPEPGYVSIFADAVDGYGGWDQTIWADGEGDEDTELFVPDMIAEHLADGEVAVFMHVGAEKQRYVNGYAIAVHSDGRQTQIVLDDIYQKAKAEFGLNSHPDQASY